MRDKEILHLMGIPKNMLNIEQCRLNGIRIPSNIFHQPIQWYLLYQTGSSNLEYHTICYKILTLKLIELLIFKVFKRSIFSTLSLKIEKTRGPSGPISLTWRTLSTCSCKVSLKSMQRLWISENASANQRPVRPSLLTDQPEKQSLEDVEYLLPVKFWWNPCSSCREVAANQRPGGHICWRISPKNTN